MTDTLSTIIARIIAVHASQGTPLDSFIDSRPADLSDLCTDLGITLEQAQDAQRAILIADEVAKVKHEDDRIGGLYEYALRGVVAGLTAR